MYKREGGNKMTMFDQLKSEGMKYIWVPQKARKKFYAIKLDLTHDTLTDDTDVFTFNAESDEEKSLLKSLPKGMWVRIVATED